MNLPVRARTIAAFLLFALSATGCTVFGDGFGDPEGELTLSSEPYVGCVGGQAFFFGSVLNTGDIEVRNAAVVVDVFNGSGAFTGRFRGAVVKDVESVEGVGPDGEPVTVDVVNDTLDVMESGSFSIQSSVGCGSFGRAEYTFSFSTGIFREE